MLDIFFADDSSQSAPTRDGMHSLISAGGIRVPSEAVRRLETALDELCARTGFPKGAEGEFKWSPGKELWMRRNLVEEPRAAFFVEALRIAREMGVEAFVVIADTSYRPATRDASSPQADVTRLLLERINTRASYGPRTIAVVVDRPGGGRRDEDQFLGDCMETLDRGTDYVAFDRIAMNVLSTPSRLVRGLQLADVVTGCTTALVAGESTYAPPVFQAVRPLLVEEGGRVGGIGLKIHPLPVYGNLYHWLVGDAYYRRGNSGWPLPDPGMPYSSDAQTYRRRPA